MALRHTDVALYIDFDGVLHHQAAMWHHKRGIYMNPLEAPGRSLFEWAHILEHMLEEFPNVQLVLSSTWCVKPGYSQSLQWLPATLRARFVGGTFHRRHHGADPWILEAFRATPRWRQILADVERRLPRAWLALDDDVADWPEQLRQNLIACNGTTGLSCPHVQDELREKLRNCS
ncbi:HAD domain-containing protein [Acidovorax sp. Be4]|uniref:HAD domain-containing protein n=1 Tax=Acidovorax bellezanensis TaxID=2976702 RepID=A0ABT2PQ74_9BURK|nr:HAD domain-containing protein [Acidovorax sp. Be4]MCT9811357.1 HAD domain-containing protein [Acidovorax sp. Be4]